ncbi:MAG: hypothetical protein ACMZ7B_06105 [Balneola sp.]
MRISLFIILSLALLSCSGSKTYVKDQKEQRISSPPDTDVIYQMFLIGDAGGAPLDRKEPALNLFKSFLDEAPEKSAAVFLGDNIYTYGLPDSAHPNRAVAEAKINAQLETVKNFGDYPLSTS